MDEDAKERITNNIDARKGINKELKDYFGYEPSIKQRRAVRNNISTGKSFEGSKVKISGNMYLKTGKNEYTRVKESQGNKVYYNSKSDTYVVKNESTGKFESVKDDKI